MGSAVVLEDGIGTILAAEAAGEREVRGAKISPIEHDDLVVT